jgi:hypothetical protein
MGLIIKTILGIILIIIFFFGLVWLYFNFFGLTPTPAHLVAETGIVELNLGTNWASVNNIDLNQGDIIRTANNGEATIIFMESSYIKLFPNTEVELKIIDKKRSKIVLQQNKGIIFSQAISRKDNLYSYFDPISKIIDYLGLNSYQIIADGMIITSIGDNISSFGIDLDEQRIVMISGQTNLDLKTINQNIKENQEAFFNVEKSSITLQQLNEDAFVKEIKKTQQDNLILIRERIKIKYNSIINMIQDKYNLSNTQINSKIDDYLMGN